MAFDQAEDLRRRLEATQTGKPYVPPPPLPESAARQASPADAPKPLAPETQAIVQRRRLEAALENNAHAQPVVIVDVKIKFWSMVVLMVKWAIAAIPATLILMAIFTVVFSFIRAYYAAH